jgi:hypothetical protein
VCHGLTVHFDAAAHTTERPRTDECRVVGIDHIVIHSPNLDRALGLWRDRLGVRLALDRAFAGRGLRMLFFRSSGVTLSSSALCPSIPTHPTVSSGSPIGCASSRRACTA